MLKYVAFFGFVLTLIAAQAQASYVAYQDTQFEGNYLGFGTDSTPNRPNGDHIGNTVTLLPGSTNLTSVVLDLFNTTGSNTFTLDLYSGTDPNTGALLGSQSVTIPNTANGNVGSITTFNFGNLAVPETLTYIVSASSGSNNSAGVYTTDGPPTIGSGPNAVWYGTTPGTFTSDSAFAPADGTANTTNHLNATFNAVPEPSSIALAAVALIGIVGHSVGRFRRA